MTTNSTCPQCGSPIPDQAPRGLCPRCLMDGALSSDPQPMVPPAIASVQELASVFPQLEVLELLGAGGMGRVYKARQTHLDRIVALKVLPPELARDPAFSERFAREARALARLNHPNIVQCYDFGQSAPTLEGTAHFYLLLEFVDGVNLRQSMRTGSLSAREALNIVPRLCDALHYAHEQGVLHRDIKPENILIDKQGRVKIADFGLARFQRKGDSEAMRLTASGAQLGTAAYMAPEQIEQPHTVDHRADIYSLGVVFYEMLTGGLPLGRFAAPSETQGVDPRLDKVVFRTLEKQANKRYQSAGEVQTQVETIAGSATPNPNAAFANDAHMENPNALHSGEAVAFPPSWTKGWPWIWRQFHLLERGTLTLEADQLVYAAAKATLTIPLTSIAEISLAPLSFAREPLGRCPVHIRWRDPSGREQVTSLLLGSRSWITKLTEIQDDTDGWVCAIREAITRKTGNTPACAHDPALSCANVTPTPLDFPKWLWLAVCALLGLFALGNLLGGNIILALPVGFIAVIVGCGIWRRTGNAPLPADPAESPPPPPSHYTTQAFASEPLNHSNTTAGPRYSRLALWAFGFATLGWGLFFTGPVIGCVLGWMSLSHIHKSDTPLRGRCFALFAALQAPLILIAGLLGGGSVALWEERLMPLPAPIAILALAALVFVLVRVLFHLATVRGLWAWRRWLGMSAMIIGMGLLGITSWAANDLDDLRLTSSQATNPFSDTPAQIFTARRHSEIEYSHTRRIYRTNEVHVLFAVVGVTAGLLFALSGLGSGALGLVLTLLISVGLYQMHPAHRMMNLFEDLSNVYPFQKPNQFPSYVDGIRVY